jgi:hypothetical protein
MMESTRTVDICNDISCKVQYQTKMIYEVNFFKRLPYFVSQSKCYTYNVARCFSIKHEPQTSYLLSYYKSVKRNHHIY